jgi:formylglycine-generating enzyme required for sulfatase activity
MHNDIVQRLIELTAGKLADAESATRQVPDDLGGVARSDVVAALHFAEIALKADAPALRGDVAAAHARLWRIRFPREEHQGLFAALADLRDSLTEIEQAAAAADYPASEATIATPPQHLVPRAPIAAELDALEARLNDIDARLRDLTAAKENTQAAAFQNAVIDATTAQAEAKSEMARELAAERQVDVKGLAHAIEGLGRIVEAFQATVAPVRARVSSLVKKVARDLSTAASGVMQAGVAVFRKALGSGVAFPVRDGDKDRQERRVPGAGVAFQDCWLERGQRMCGPEMVVVPAGEFMMGAAQSEIDALSKEYKDWAESFKYEAPQHKVAIAKPFAVGRFAATFGEFSAFVNETGHKVPDEAFTFEGGRWEMRKGRSFRNPGFAQDDTHPVVCVNWEDAKAYLKWLSAKTGKDYRLLSEAEWEYSCRAGTSTPFWWGGSISTEQANYDGNAAFGRGEKGEYRQRTVPVKSFQPNPWGLYQVHGNVWEWCEDCWNDSYNGAPADGVAWTTGDRGSRVLRGGSWFYLPAFLRAAARDRYGSTLRLDYAGFRVARTLNP